MPTPIITTAAFQADTRIRNGPPREVDAILLEIDRLLDAFHGSRGPESMAYLGKLLFAADRWLKHPRTATPWRLPTPDEAFSQRATIEQFRLAVLRRLMEETKLYDEASVRAWWEKTFANPRTPEMTAQDERTRAQYYSPTELENFRLTFMNGIVWIRKWWQTTLSYDLARFDTPSYTSHFKNNVSPGADGDTSKDWANFVLTVDGEFYSTWHQNGTQGRFHSAYTGGKPVYFAGEILVRDGIVFGLNNRSGHYIPDIYKLRDAIEMLKMLDVNIEQVQVADWASKTATVTVMRFTGQDLLDAYPARYVVDAKEPRQAVLARRVEGIPDVVVTPLFRWSPPGTIDGFDNIMDNVDGLLAAELAAHAKHVNLRVVPLTPSMRATINLKAQTGPNLEAVKKWGMNLVLVPEFDFDLRRAQLGRLAVNCIVVKKLVSETVQNESEDGTPAYYDLTKGAQSLVRMVGPLARKALQTLIQLRDG